MVEKIKDMILLLSKAKSYRNLKYGRVLISNKEYLNEIEAFFTEINFNCDNVKTFEKRFNDFLIKKRNGKKASINSPSYWMSLGYYDENEVKEIVSLEQKKRSIFSKEKWMKDGLTEEEAKEKIRSIQSGISKRYVKGISKIKNTWNKDFWINKGFSEEDAKIEVLKRNPSSRLFYKTEEEWLEKRKRIALSVSNFIKEKPEVYKSFFGSISKEEIRFFDEIMVCIPEIQHITFLVNPKNDIRTTSKLFKFDGYIKTENGLILIEYDGFYWHNIEYDNIKDDITLEIRPDILGIIRFSSNANSDKDKINKLKDGINKIKNQECKKIRIG